MSVSEIRSVLKKNNIIADGAFGTYYEMKFHINDVPERANLEYPERVTSIHRDYLEAGATLIRANTFSANTFTLGQDFDEVEKCISAAIKNAEAAIGQIDSDRDIFLAGDIGPIDYRDAAGRKKARDEFFRIAETMISGGLKILHFETFADLEDISYAIRQIKEKHPEVFIMVTFSVNQMGYSGTGLSAKRLVSEALQMEEIDASGLNCGTGPGHMCSILQKIDIPENKFLVVLPNAGYPKLIRGRFRYGDSEEYFAGKMKDISEAGADIIGGCCGTNPEYIRKIADIDDIVHKREHQKSCVHVSPDKNVARNGFLYDGNGRVKNKKLIAVELIPPFTSDDEKLLESAYLLKDSDVDVLTFPDSPSGRTRVDAVLMAQKIHSETGMAVMPHICCRDKNAIAMRSMFLGAKINDINNMLIITGDPVPSMARQTTKAVFNFDSVGLMKIAREMNQEFFSDAPICYGGAINQGRKNLDIEIERIKKKQAEGAEFFMTQPVFTVEDAARIRRIKEETGARILCGIMPLVSRRNALFMQNELAGVDVTDDIVARYSENATKEEGESVGIALAREVISMVENIADGYYFSFPFNRVYLLDKIMKK